MKDDGFTAGPLVWAPEPGCTRMGWFGSKPCHFEPRYDTTFDGMDRHKTGNWLAPNFEKGKAVETYVADVCVSCGRVVKRSP